LVVSTCFMSLTKMLGTRSVSEFRFSWHLDSVHMFNEISWE
jgi:hypothetical protein